MDAHRFKNIERLIESDLVTDDTRRVLQARLNARETPPRFFDAHDFAILKAVCAALAPSSVVADWFVANAIDQRLAEKAGNGWRYDAMPLDGISFRSGLQMLEQMARTDFQKDFIALEIEKRNELFRRFKSNDKIETDENFAPARFLEELCAEFAEIFYSHPLALGEIGYIGFADAKGWQLGVQSSKSKVQSREDELRITNDELRESKIHNPQSKIQNPVDAVVSGTGAGGAPLLARLAQAGLKVVALEAGKDFDYQKFPTDERAQNDLFWTDERLSAGRDPMAFGNNNSGCGVGGSTLHFTAYAPRPHPDDFRLFTEFGVGCDWPLAYEDLEPYFDELEWFLGISGASPYPWGKPRKKDYPLPPLPLNGAAKLMQRACEKLGIKTAPAPNAALSHDYFQKSIGLRHACTNRGFCQAGCRIGAKGSMDVTFLPLAVANGAEIRAECFVTEFEFDSNGLIKAVIYVQNGETKKQLCRNVFLCAGAIETPRLLLINNLANSSRQVGRWFMAHTGVQVWGVFDREIFPHRGILGGLISEDTHRPQKRFDADFAGGYLLQSIGVMPVTYASQLARGEKIWGAGVGAWMADYNRTAGINILGECLPYEHNFVKLANELDARGLPKPRVHFSHGENEKRMTRHAEKLMREIWTAAGAQKMWTYQRNAHIIGTYRMGADAGEAVVDQNGRSFDVPNLYVADNSVFPSALAVNPALTIMALALRTADRFLESSKFNVQGSKS